VVDYEDPSCPYCRRFEKRVGDLLRRQVAAGAISVEYRIRCFLGPESVRASAALAAAASVRSFDPLLAQVFANQPPEHSGGFTTDDLIGLGDAAGIADPSYADAVRSGALEAFALEREARFAIDDPDGTPGVWVNGAHVRGDILYDAIAFSELLHA